MAVKFDAVIVGGGVAGIEAAITIKKVDATKSVAIVSEEDLVYPRSAVVCAIAGSIKSANDVAIYPNSLLGDTFQITTFQNCRVLSIKSNEQVVQVKDMQKGDVFDLMYRNLVLATGSVPAIPKMKQGMKGIFGIKWFNDALELSNYAASRKRAYVVGAGFIGLEVTEALRKIGAQVTVVEKEDHILPTLLEPDLSNDVARNIRLHGVRILNGASLEEIGGDRRVEYVVVGDQKLPADVVVFAAGIKPNTTQLAETGLKMNRVPSKRMII